VLDVRRQPEKPTNLFRAENNGEAARVAWVPCRDAICRPVAVGLDLKGRVGMRSIGVFMACAGMLLSLTAAYGLPKQIIILRHAEKTDTGGLCSVGEGRKNALVAQYLGKGAKDSLFVSGEQPAAFYAITATRRRPLSPRPIPGRTYRSSSPAKFTKRNFQMTGRTDGPRILQRKCLQTTMARSL